MDLGRNLRGPSDETHSDRLKTNIARWHKIPGVRIDAASCEGFIPLDVDDGVSSPLPTIRGTPDSSDL